jgi:hypothetical protein
MRETILNLNYLHVLAVTVLGFLFGWLWYGPLFSKSWMTEMKITEAQMKAQAEKGMAGYLIKGFIYTLLSTFGIAVIIAARGVPEWWRGAVWGGFIGAFIVGARILNNGNWENRSMKLQAINVSHEILLFALQGAILSAWH